MKKILSVVAVISSIMIVGCSVKDSAQPSSSSMKSSVININNRELTQLKIHKLIVKAGEKDGWEMTEFRGNEVIAEKMEGEESINIIVKFNTETVKLTPEDSDLSDAISTALKKQKSKF